MEREIYKVLIADDEYWTREKLCHMIDWERYSLCCLEPAADGEEVLQKIQIEQPDILITDINMPFMNGIELLQRVQSAFPDIITFVVSGYDDFQYVKEAFMAGTINYLIKPITKIDLVNALVGALELISERKNRQKEQEQQRIELLKASSLLQDREFSQFLEREEAPFTPVITINNDIDFAGVSLMLVKIHDMSHLSRQYQYDMNLLSYSVKKEMKKYLKSEDLFVFNHIYRPNEFAVISELDNAELVSRAGCLMIRMREQFRSPLTVMISGHSYSMDSIHEAYIKNIAMLMTRKYSPENVLLVSRPELERAESRNISSRFVDTQAAELKKLFHTGNRTAIEALLLKTTGLELCEAQQWTYLEVKQTVRRIMNTLSEILQPKLQSEEAAVLENMITMADRTVERLTVSMICEAIRDVVDYGLSVGREEAALSLPDIVRRTAKYIDEYYYEDLSLTSLANQFGVEKSYFSRLFRQETGENLMLYITRKRMEKACEYMRGSDISLTEIAFMVGYDDYAYFNRVFRKTYGRSPRDYRATAVHG
ncbi:MAG: response regulator transcription factor [Lachnospiraceae bacterium]